MQVYSIKKRLNIPEYKIAAILSEIDKEIHIKLEPYKRKPFGCSGCGQVYQIGQHALEESTVEDLSMFKKRVYLHGLKKYSRVTKRFAEKVNRLTAITTNQEAGWFFRIDKEILEEQYAARLLPYKLVQKEN